MSDRKRRRALGVAALVLIGVLGLGLALFGLSDESTTRPTTTGATSPTTGFFPPAVTGQVTDQEGVVDVGTFSIDLPEGASGVERSSSGNRDQLTFSIGQMNGAASSQESRPGESLDELASIYGPLKGKRVSKLAGNPAYLFSSTSGGRFSLVVLGRAQGRDYAIQLVGPAAELPRARQLALDLAASTRAR